MNSAATKYSFRIIERGNIVSIRPEGPPDEISLEIAAGAAAMANMYSAGYIPKDFEKLGFGPEEKPSSYAIALAALGPASVLLVIPKPYGVDAQCY